MNEHPATLLRCVVERITYQNPENGYSVLKVKVKGYNDLVTLVGNLLEVPVGSVLLCRGEWKVDKRYGSQFVAATWEEVRCEDRYRRDRGQRCERLDVTPVHRCPEDGHGQVRGNL